MVKKKRPIQDDLLAAFYDFDYPAYYKAKSRIKKMTPELKNVITRIETHPTFGKTRSTHRAWVKKQNIKRESAYEREMMRDALAGRHYKHGSTFFGDEIVYDKDYLAICKKMGVKKPR